MPTELPTGLKNFPVVEVVLSVQFEPITTIHTAHLWRLWEEYREAFPEIEQRPPLDQVIEQFSDVPSARPGLKFQTLESLPVRVWFVNSQGSEMIQVQSDRFIKNWRKEGEDERYPRYSHIRPKFDRDFQTFLTFLERNEVAVPPVNQCEVTYVNHIVAGEGWDRHNDLEKVFTFWQLPPSTPPGTVEDVQLHARFVIPGEANRQLDVCMSRCNRF